MNYTKSNPWRDSSGTHSLCIGCDYNKDDYSIPTSAVTKPGLSRRKQKEATKPENMYNEKYWDILIPYTCVCDNPKSPIYKGCIVGHHGCEFTSLPD